MRRFSINVDLRKKEETTRSVKIVSEPAGSTDGLVLSESLAPKRQALRDWADFQRRLMSLPPVRTGPEEFEDQALAEEYVRIYTVTREKILEAAPGFEQVEKLEQHCYFDADGSKHVVSRLVARPHLRVTELSLFPSGEINRVYYENAGGPDQDLDSLYELGLGGLESDLARFSRYPHYRLKFVSLPCRGAQLTDIYRGLTYYDSDSGSIQTVEQE